MGKIKKKYALQKAGSLWILFGVLILFSGACSSDGENPIPDFPPPPLIFDSYHITISELTTTPLSEVIPPVEGSVPDVEHPGVFLIFRDHDITLTVGQITVNGSEVTVEVTVKNESGTDFPRTWVIVHSPDNGTALNILKADGLIDDGVFYYLGGLADGEEKSTSIYFTLPSYLITQFSFLLDVGEVHDRLTFASTQAGPLTEIYSMNYNGSDLFRVTYHNGAVYPSMPRWSPTGGWVAYTGKASSESEQIWLARADGKESIQLTCYDDDITVAGDFTKDGKKIYVRHMNSSTPEANIYLLDISKALADCSDTSALTPLTVAFPGSENVPILSKDGDKLVYIKREYKAVKPPPPCDQTCGNPTVPCFGNPPKPCCGDPPEPCCGTPPTPWTDKYVQNFNLYYLPVSPQTGERTGDEVKYWDETLFTRGDMCFSSDGTMLVANAGGCAEWEACCPGQTGCASSGSTWTYKCNFSLPRAIYTLDFDTTLPDPMPYSYLSAPGSTMYRKIDGTGDYEYDPSWSIEYDLLAFSKLDLSTTYIQLWLLDPVDPLNTKVPIANFGYFNASPRFMPWP